MGGNPKAEEKKNPYMITYWMKYDFFRHSAFPYMSGLHTGTRSKKVYIPSEGKVRDPNTKVLAFSYIKFTTFKKSKYLSVLRSRK